MDDNRELDRLAVAALSNEMEFERLLKRFNPFLLSQVSKWKGRSSIYRDEMTSAAMMAFHEAVQSFNPSKGHFYHLLKTIVHKRLIDCYRNVTAKHVDTIPLETENDEEGLPSRPLIAASIKTFQDTTRRRDMASEIEEFKQDLGKWKFNMAILAKNSPKHAQTRAAYRKIVQFGNLNIRIMIDDNTSIHQNILTTIPLPFPIVFVTAD